MEDVDDGVGFCWRDENVDYRIQYVEIAWAPVDIVLVLKRLAHMLTVFGAETQRPGRKLDESAD